MTIYLQDIGGIRWELWKKTGNYTQTNTLDAWFTHQFCGIVSLDQHTSLESLSGHDRLYCQLMVPVTARVGPWLFIGTPLPFDYPIPQCWFNHDGQWTTTTKQIKQCECTRVWSCSLWPRYRCSVKTTQVIGKVAVLLLCNMLAKPPNTNIAIAYFSFTRFTCLLMTPTGANHP